MNRSIKTIGIVSFLGALAGLTFFHFLDHQRSQIIHTSCMKTDGDFILTFKRSGLNNKKFEILNLRPGLISIVTRPKVNEVVLVSKDQVLISTDKKSESFFQKRLWRNLILNSIRFTPKSQSINRIDVLIYRKPLISLPLVFLQLVFLFALNWLTLNTFYFLFQSIFRRQEMPTLPINPLVYGILFLLATFFLFILFNPKALINQYGFSDISPTLLSKTILFNLLLAAIFIVLFYLFSFRSKREKLPLIGVALAGFPILLINIPFDVKTSGDSLLWILNLLHRDPNISFAESFGLILNKFLFWFFNLFTPVNERATLITTGKLMGLLFLFSFFVLINTYHHFSFKKKLLFFFLFSTFGFNILLLGFPELSYYSVPFLILSLAAARKYLSEPKDHQRHLFLAAIWLFIAGLFHGMAYFSFPVIFLLPLLKNRTDHFSKTFILDYGKQLGLILLAMGIVFLSAFLLIKIPQFTLQLYTASGGYDGSQFIAFLPAHIHFPNAVVFLEPGYFISRGYILLISGAFIFLFLLFRRQKKASLEIADWVSMLFGLSQFLIVLFWGFDLGIFDFDLYIAPTTFILLFLIQYFLSTMDAENKGWKAIMGFTLFSMLYPLMTVMLLGNKW